MTTNAVVSGKPLKYTRGMNPNSRKNLRPGNHGQNHNPNGYSLTADIKHELHEEAEFIAPTSRPKDKLWREQIKRAILTKAALGDVPMVKELLDRTEGKVPDKHAIVGDIVIRIVEDDDDEKREV